MAHFCPNCGTPLEGTVSFCPNCGGATAPTPVSATVPPTVPTPILAGNGEVREGIPAPGFSDRVSHPEILAAVQKNRRAAWIFMLILIPLPLLGFVLYSQVSGNMELSQAATYGGIISAIFLVFALFGLIRNRMKKSYEAVVIDKKTRQVTRSRNGEDQSRETVTEYITVARTTDGKKKKIVETEGSQIWVYHYLLVGDRFRYHPQFHFPYERYEKASAPYLVCVSCGTQNPVEADRCRKCRLPLLK